MANVVVGGTFEYLHAGHHKLLKKAFELAQDGKVSIGLTSNLMANLRNREVPEYNIRYLKLINHLKKIVTDQNYTIMEISDPYGNTLLTDYDYIVVSPETYSMALKINEKRKEKHLSEIEIVKIDYVLAEDHEPISSTRISKGEIDIHGRLKKTY